MSYIACEVRESVCCVVSARDMCYVRWSYYLNIDIYSNGMVCCSFYTIHVVVGRIWKWNYNLCEIHVNRKLMWNVLDLICALSAGNKYC